MRLSEGPRAKLSLPAMQGILPLTASSRAASRSSSGSCDRSTVGSIRGAGARYMGANVRNWA